MLQDKDALLQLKEKERSLDVSDITQSKAYNEFGMGTYDISVSWNTDGVPLFESSKFSIWPLQLQVNELPFKYRVKRVLLAGLWFGEQKPDMNCFLKPFVDELNRLSSEGLSWTNPDGLSKRTRVFPGPCVVDTVARAMIMNMTQFNGAHGCAWCEQKGEVVQKGDGHVRVYPVESLKGNMRTDVSMRRCARQAEKKKMPVLGVKGSNILFLLSFFKFPSSFVVDYMHAVCSGFVRHTAFMWFDHKKAHPYSLGGSVSCIDERLSGLQPVFEMPRLPRSLAHRKYWKSSEWRNWLLYFSPIVLVGILPQPYYNNWLKFVSLMHVLLADSVSSELLRSVQKQMFLFLKEYEVLYGKENITFNAHSLLHLVDSVREWGPLWNFSAYPYENMNGRLVRLVNGTRHAQWQIVEKFQILLAMPRLCATTVVSSSPVRDLLTAMLKGYRLRVHCTVLPEYTLLGKGQRTPLGIEYKKIVVAGFTINVSALDKSRRTNSYVQVKSDEPVFGQVTSIAHAPCETHVQGCDCNVIIFFLRKLSVKDRVIKHEIVPTTRNIYLVEPTSTVMEVTVNKVKKCVGLTVEGKLYVSPLESNHVLEVV
ncbi:uncharacterized protein [Dermacentor albipictus]|uniref:uncharacterized protein n=1 Tax=Dermacentor albipictus TaxID=60249 RepID=UPI0038FD21C4